MLNYVWLWRPSWSEVRNARHNFGRGPPKDHFSKVWLRLAQWFQRRRFFKYFIPPFSIFSLAAILVGSRDHRTQFSSGGPPKDHSTKVWLQLAEWFLRRRLKCEMLTERRKVMAIAHLAAKNGIYVNLLLAM